MNHIRTLINGGLLASLLVLSACDTNSTSIASNSTETASKLSTPASYTLEAQLSGDNEVPEIVGEGSGTFTASIDQQTRALKWTINYSGLSGPVTAAHFHGPAQADENTEAVVPITGNLTLSPIERTTTLTEAQMEELKAGKWYVNLHTEANPKGEIRGQVSVQK
ncbi:CHRD domain-containing protein [Paraglaciecola sp. 25GB23A]|uniref:CHRD domain-containing protein n=1 Tax=Paraglaciecola sp. 25GB23A TaxID=3156068 RepID=UPI0032AE9516